LPTFARKIGQAQVAGATAAETAGAAPKPANLPSIDPSAHPKPAPANSIWAKVKGWLPGAG
jgi:hypothetical protein